MTMTMKSMSKHASKQANEWTNERTKSMGTFSMCSRKLSEKKKCFNFFFLILLSGLSWRFLKSSVLPHFSHISSTSVLWAETLTDILWCVCYFIQFIHSFMLVCVRLFFSSCCTHFGLPLILPRCFVFLFFFSLLFFRPLIVKARFIIFMDEIYLLDEMKLIMNCNSVLGTKPQKYNSDLSVNVFLVVLKIKRATLKSLNDFYNKVKEPISVPLKNIFTQSYLIYDFTKSRKTLPLNEFRLRVNFH